MSTHYRSKLVHSGWRFGPAIRAASRPSNTFSRVCLHRVLVWLHGMRVSDVREVCACASEVTYNMGDMAGSVRVRIDFC